MGSGSESGRFESLNRFRSLPEAILAARRTHGAGRVAFEDTEGSPPTYGQLTLVAAVLGRRDERRDGRALVCVPPSSASTPSVCVKVP